MISTRPPISKSPSPCINPLMTVPRAPITIGINVTFMFHSFSIPRQGRSSYLYFRFLSVLFWGQLGQQSPHIGKFSFSYQLLQGPVVWPRLGDPFVSQNTRGICVPHSPGQTLGCAYTICSYDQISISSQFPLNHLPGPVVFSLKFFLR